MWNHLENSEGIQHLNPNQATLDPNVLASEAVLMASILALPNVNEFNEESDEESDDEIVISEIFEESGERSNILDKNYPFAIFNSDSEDEIEFLGF